MMTTEHVPEWDEIATGFGEYAEWLCKQENSDAGYGHDYRDGSGYLAAQRWLNKFASQQQTVGAVKALREAAGFFAKRGHIRASEVADQMMVRADRIASEAAAELQELREKVASLQVGCYDLTREELIERITAVGPEEWKSGYWLGAYKAKQQSIGAERAIHDLVSEADRSPAVTWAGPGGVKEIATARADRLAAEREDRS